MEELSQKGMTASDIIIGARNNGFAAYRNPGKHIISDLGNQKSEEDVKSIAKRNSIMLEKCEEVWRSVC